MKCLNRLEQTFDSTRDREACKWKEEFAVMSWADQEGEGVWFPPGKPQVVTGFLRNTGADPLEKQLDPSGRSTTLCEIR